MRGGVLIAGSLAWDDSKHRRQWRADRLLMSEAVPVHAPLRYGRLSSTRDHTYTMVFSATCLSKVGGTGVGLAVPLAGDVTAPATLVQEGRWLWAAERKSTSLIDAVSASWGSVGLLIRAPSGMGEAVLAEWAGTVRRSPNYGRLPTVAEERPILQASTGLATFPWPRRTDGEDLDMDFLFFTATAAHIVGGAYPTPKQIADAWNRAPVRAEYFLRNREMGILTDEDESIAALLSAPRE